MADGAYLRKENRKYLKEKNILHTGKAMDRSRQMTRTEQLEIKKAGGERNHVEGKFGQAKNGYGLTHIRARGKVASEAWIGGIWLAMNLKRYMDLVSKLGLMAIIQFVIVFLCAFLDKIKAFRRAVAA
jgi:IS5 family transposase